MSAITRPPNDIAIRPADPVAPSALRSVASAALILAAVVCLLAIIAGASLLAYGRLQHGDTVFDGVSAAGLDLSGKSQSDASGAPRGAVRRLRCPPDPLRPRQYYLHRDSR